MNVISPIRPARDLRQTSLFLAALILSTYLLATVVRHAWMSDDAYITLRTVDNFVHGHGLVYNRGERVQAFTHPLWLGALSLAYGFTKEAFVTTLVVSICATAAVLLLLWYHARSTETLLVALATLAGSKAFVDYSTSGLENPLSHLLVLLFFGFSFGSFLREGDSTKHPPTGSGDIPTGQFFWHRSGNAFNRLSRFVNGSLWISNPRSESGPTSNCLLFCQATVASLLVLNRLDLGLLVFPPLTYELLRRPSFKRLRVALVAALPVLLWEMFSLYYYGFLVPNTAFAKLNTGIIPQALLAQGVRYFQDAIQHDPVTVPLTGFCMLAAIVTRRAKHVFAASGVLFYLIYIAWIGGDFMRGRFLSVPLFAAVTLLVLQDWSSASRRWIGGLVVGIVVLAALAPQPTLLPFHETRGSERIAAHGIVDERRFYIENSLFWGGRFNWSPQDRRRTEGEEAAKQNLTVYLVGGAGLRGYYAGPDVHVVDYFALVDPLLARLPAIRDPNWRIGHFIRKVPEGYLDTLNLDTDLMEDPDLADYYERLSTLTRGPFSRERLRTIWLMNRGHFDHLIDRDRYRHPYVTQVPWDQLVTWRAAHAPPKVDFAGGGLEIALPQPFSDLQLLEVSLDSESDFEISYFEKGREIAINYLTAENEAGGSLTTYFVEVGPHVSSSSIDTIRIFPVSRKESYGIGHARLWGPDTWPACSSSSACIISFDHPQIVSLLEKGWSVPESWGIWSVDYASELRVFLNKPAPAIIRVNLFPLDSGQNCSQSVELRLDHVSLGEQHIDTCEAQELIYPVPAELPLSQTSLLTFVFGSLASPHELSGGTAVDRRMLAAGFLSVEIIR